MAQTKYVVNGFSFQSELEYYEASKEAESIEYIKAKTDLSNMKTVLKLYNSLLDKESFHTVVGLAFLTGMRNNLVRSKIAAIDEIRSIPVKPKEKDKITTADDMVKEKILKENIQIKDSMINTRQRLKNMYIVIGFLSVIIIIMFVISWKGNTIIGDYETKIQDKYAAWEEELTAREEAVEEREEALQ